MIRRRDEDEDAMMLMMMTTPTLGTDGSGTSASAFSNASRARHPSSTTVPPHHRAHAREFGLEELFARVSLPATLAARSMGVSETTFKLRCDARGVGKRRKRRKYLVQMSPFGNLNLEFFLPFFLFRIFMYRERRRFF